MNPDDVQLKREAMLLQASLNMVAVFGSLLDKGLSDTLNQKIENTIEHILDDMLKAVNNTPSARV